VDALIVTRRLSGLAQACLFGACCVHAAAGAESLEVGIKAAYLYKFAPFVEWPDKVFASPDSPINLCIAGSDPFGPSLDRIVAGQRVGGRPIAVRHIGAVAPDTGCQIAFLGGPAEQSSAEAAALHGQPVLTVSDQGGGGIVSFVIVDNRVRFTIDKSAADDAHIVISSKLLNLAVEKR
jgi:hypothetical protein